MRFLRAAVAFTKPELLCQEEKGSVQAFWGEAYDTHQIKLRHVKKMQRMPGNVLEPCS